MPKLVFLGTANAIPDENHENTHLAIIGEDRRILIDCPGNPVIRLKKSGIDLNRLTDLFLTHFHPDHVAGVPPLLMSMWLMGRRDEFSIYGLEHTLDRLKRLMDLFEWEEWPNFFPVRFHRIPEKPMSVALKSKEFLVYSSPVEHLLPAIGIRVEARQIGIVLAYSGDTAPCDAVIGLADMADVLIHEATGQQPGHSSASQAGQIAARAAVGSLYLIHYNPQDRTLESQAEKEFPGPVQRAKDFMMIEL
jgi:ribonuclease Z